MARETIETCRFSAGGFTVEVDAVVFDGDVEQGYAPPVDIHALALLGPRESTRAIWARLIRGKSDGYLVVEWAGEGFSRSHPARLHLHEKGFWRKIESPQPEATAHHLLLLGRDTFARRSDLAEGESCLLLPARGTTGNDWASQAVRFLQPRLSFHLFQEWGTALWSHLIASGEARPLRAWGFPGGVRAYRLRPNVPGLQAFIAAQVRAGALVVPGTGRSNGGGDALAAAG